MHPKVLPVRTITTEGAPDEIVLLPRGGVEVEVGGTVLARLGPGAVLGERASPD